MKTDTENVYATSLRVVEHDSKYAVQLGRADYETSQGRLLVTPGGQIVSSDSRGLLDHLILELQQFPVLEVKDSFIESPRPLCAYLIYSTQVDFVEPGSTMLAECNPLDEDALWNPSPGPEQVDQYNAWSSVRSFLSDCDIEYRPLGAMSEKEKAGTGSKLRGICEGLSPAQKAVVSNLVALHESVTCALALAKGACTAVDYANACLATMPIHHTFGMEISEEQTPAEMHEQYFAQLRDHARVAIDYLRFFHPEMATSAKSEIARLLEVGESKVVERKSTLRWNIRAERNDDAMTHSCLKTIAAFLNTEDGHLLVGVDDNGQIAGIELDGFANGDGFLIHLFNVIKQSMGAGAAALVDAKVVNHEGKDVCIVACCKSPEPVYMKFKKGDEEFFVRTGPSTLRLPTSDIHAYILNNFGNA